MIKLSIADVLCEIESKRRYLHNDLKAFRSGLDKPSDLKVKVCIEKELSYPRGEMIIDDSIGWYRPEQGRCQSFYRQDDTSLAAILDTDSYWSNAVIRIRKAAVRDCVLGSKSMLEVMFRNHIIQKNGLVIHASAIKWQEKGIMFSAPSGTGKSTQAGLWEEHMKAEILNGDRPAVRLTNTAATVYGTPWSGQMPVFRNDKAKLSAIFMLDQAFENRLELLDTKKAVSMLMPRCFLPYHDDTMMDIAVNNLERLLSLVPVYHLRCRPDRGAVELVYQCVK
jgi:hypothetical protein